MKTCVKCGMLFEVINCPACALRRSRAWREKNIARYKEREKTYLEANRVKAALRAKEHYSKNKEQKLIYAAEYRNKNKKSIAAKSKKYNQKNKESHRTHDQNRRARKLKAGGKLSISLFDRLFKLQRGKCACCHVDLSKKTPHMDHVVPLALGGPNSDENMQLLCKSCNLSKRAKHPVDFMQSRGFLL